MHASSDCACPTVMQVMAAQSTVSVPTVDSPTTGFWLQSLLGMGADDGASLLGNTDQSRTLVEQARSMAFLADSVYDY